MPKTLEELDVLSLTRYIIYDAPGMPAETDAYVSDFDDGDKAFSPHFVLLMPFGVDLPIYLHHGDIAGVSYAEAIDRALEAYAVVHQLELARWRRGLANTDGR